MRQKSGPMFSNNADREAHGKRGDYTHFELRVVWGT
jgi:hypothetical protein